MTSPSMTVFAESGPCPWFDSHPHFKHYIVAQRKRGSGILDSVHKDVRALDVDWSRPFTNDAPVMLADPELIGHFADLLWRDELGVSELWWLADFRESGGVAPWPEKLRALIPTRSVEMPGDPGFPPWTLLLARVRSIDAITALIPYVAPMLLNCQWLALSPAAGEAFNTVQPGVRANAILEATDLGTPGLSAYLAGGNVESAWLYTVTQDALILGSGDPFFTVPTYLSLRIEEAFRAHARRRGQIYRETILSKPVYVLYTQTGVVVLPPNGQI